MTQPTETPSAPFANLWRRTRSTGVDGRATLHFWLMMLALGTISWGAVTWAASNLLAKKGPEKLLRLSLHLPKLNINHAPAAAPSELAHPAFSLHWPSLFGSSKVKVVETPPHVEHATTASPWAIPLTNPPHGEIETACDEPVVYLQPCTLQPGDSPMTRTWKTVTMYSLLAGAISLAPPPLLAQGDKGIQEKDKTEPNEKLQKSIEKLISRIEGLEKRLDSLEKKPGLTKEDLTDAIKKLEDGALKELDKKVVNAQAEQLKQKRDIDDLNFELEKLRKRMVTAEKPGAGPVPDKAFMEELREIRSSIKSLEEKIARTGPTEQRVSGYPNGGAAVASKTGKVVLINFYSADVLYVINGVTYKLPPGSTKVVENVPAGELRYEAIADRWGLLESRTTTLVPNDTFTLVANPR